MNYIKTVGYLHAKMTESPSHGNAPDISSYKFSNAFHIYYSVRNLAKSIIQNCASEDQKVSSVHEYPIMPI